VIGGSILVAGTLLILAGLVWSRIPGGATVASSGIGRSRAFLLSPIHPATWYANGAILLGAPVAILSFTTIVSIVSAGFASLLFGVGVVLLGVAIEGCRLIARIERRRAFAGEPVRPLAHPYRPLRGSFRDILRAEFGDESRWRDVLYVAVNLPLSLLEVAVVASVWVLALTIVTTPLWYDAAETAALPWFLGPWADHDALSVSTRTLLGLALLPVAASISQLVIALHRGVVRGLLCTSESRELRRQVETLRESRSAVLDVEATELHRIERDLHDGAQQRLVMLTIDLGLASERIDEDPAAAKALILEGQAEARQALAEIRDLVRGIAPSILLDRGLIAALQSIAGRGPVPTVIESDLAASERLPAATERAAYFVVTEALANVAKHSGARRCTVRCHRDDAREDGPRLVVEVSDDGRGGATIEPGGGLAGLSSRVAGVDGTFAVSSPPGGPTVVRAEIPIGPGLPTSNAAARPQEPR
jgi:signal transduction histidine kinase